MKPTATPSDPRSRGGSVSDSVFMSFNTGEDEDPAMLDSVNSAGLVLRLNSRRVDPVVAFDGDDLVVVKTQLDASGGHLQPPSTEVRLSALRFIVTVLLGVGVVVGVMLVFLYGVTIKRGITDTIGSSKNADNEVEFFQTFSGYLTAAFGLLVEKYFALFLAVMLTYFGNLKLYPGDRPQHGQTRRKRFALFCFTPVTIYVVNVGISSLNIQHSTSGVLRVFVKQDLVTSTFTANATALASEPMSVENTILRSAVRRQVVPFEVMSNSSCKLENATSAVDAYLANPAELPAVKEIRSTTVDFGFLVQDWNRAVFPTALEPTHQVMFVTGQVDAGIEAEVAKFQAATGFAFLTGYELFLQGKTQFERAVSDANSSSTYPCTLVDGRAQDDGANATSKFPFFARGPYKDMRVCTGAISSLPALANMTDPATHNVRSFAAAVASGFNTTLKQIAAEEIVVRLETYALSSQMNLTALSVHIPYALDAQYRDLSEYCTPQKKLKPSVLADYTGDTPPTKEEVAELEAVLCDQAFYPFDKPNSLCGSDNCVFLDKSEFGVHLRKQLLLLPYVSNCSVANMEYNNDVLNFLPSGCQPHADAVFLYGLGSYMTGTNFDLGFAGSDSDSDEPSSVPSLLNPRRYLTLSFAKLDWKLEDLSAAFGAKCGVPAPGNCDGLAFVLSNASSPVPTQALLLGKDALPSHLAQLKFWEPVQLVTLNARPFYYPQYDKYFEWEYLDHSVRFDSKNSSLDVDVLNKKLSGSGCSLLVDSYLQQIEANHYFLDEPLQALYTSAIFYLYQDAAVKALNVPAKKAGAVNFAGLALQNTGVRFKGDRERKQIKYSIPLASAIGTFTGLALLLLFGAAVMLFPRERLRKTDEPNSAARLAAVLTADVYHAAVHKRELVYRAVPGAAGEEREKLDDYAVDSITFHHQRDPDRKVFM
ncbi:hypothetical protein PybrP1_004866 [[Pythium] brassicae (nom. inval.)]|nr:hypothetical protein PybrP1_004866 [[Pythium] brassicae (nom. inval.)]